MRTGSGHFDGIGWRIALWLAVAAGVALLVGG